jgi:hypothetical protein
MCLTCGERRTNERASKVFRLMTATSVRDIQEVANFDDPEDALFAMSEYHLPRDAARRHLWVDAVEVFPTGISLEIMATRRSR